MGLEQQLQFPFIVGTEQEEKKQESMEHLKFSAKIGAVGGYGLLIIALTNRQGFADDPSAIAMLTIGTPYLSVAGQFALGKTVDISNRVQESLRNFYRYLQENRYFTGYKS